MPRRADIDINVRANARAVGELRKEFQSNERSTVKGFERIGQAGSRAFRDVERARERAFGGRRQRVGGFAQTLRQLKDVTRTTNEFAASIKVIPKEFESAVRRSRRELSKLEESYKRAFGTTGRIGGRRAEAPTVSNALTGGFRETLRQLREQQKQLDVARVATNRYSDSFISLRKQVSRTTETVRGFVSRGLRGLRGFGVDSLRRLGEQFRRFGSSVGRAVTSARRHFSNFRRSIEQGARRINRTVDRTRDRLASLSKAFNLNPVTRLFRTIGGAVSSVFTFIGRTVSRVVSAIRSTVSTITGLVAGLGITRAFRAVVDAGQRAELSIVQLGTLFRTTRKEATDLFFAVREFARPLPVTTEEVVSAFIRLRSVGIEPTEDRMKGLLNASLALGRPLSNIVLAVQSLETESLRKLGINLNRRGEDAILNFGTETIILPKDDRAIREALIDLFNRAFGGAIEDSLQNFRVNLAVLQSVVGDTTSDLGLKFLPSLTTILQRTTAWLEVNRKLVDTRLGDFFENIGKALENIVSTARIDSVFRTFLDFIDRISGSPQAVEQLVDRVEDSVRSFYNWLDPIKQVTTAIRLLGKGIGFIGSTIGFVTGLFGDFVDFLQRTTPGGELGIDANTSELQKVVDEYNRVDTAIRRIETAAQFGQPRPRDLADFDLRQGRQDREDLEGLVAFEKRVADQATRINVRDRTDEELAEITAGRRLVPSGLDGLLIQPDRAAREATSRETARRTGIRDVEGFDGSFTFSSELDKVREGVIGIGQALNQLSRDLNSTELAFSTLAFQQKQNEKAAFDLASVAGSEEAPRSLFTDQQLQKRIDTIGRALRSGALDSLNERLDDMQKVADTATGALKDTNNQFNLTGKRAKSFNEFIRIPFEERGQEAREPVGLAAIAEQTVFDYLFNFLIPTRLPEGATREQESRFLDEQLDPRTETGAQNIENARNLALAQIRRQVPDFRFTEQGIEAFVNAFETLFGNRKDIELIRGERTDEEQLRATREGDFLEKTRRQLVAVFDQALSRTFRNIFRGNFARGLRGFFSDLQAGISDVFANTFSQSLTGENSPFAKLAEDGAKAIRESVKGIGEGLSFLFDSTFGRIGEETRVETVSGVAGDPRLKEVTDPGPLAGRAAEVAAATLVAISAGQQGRLQGAIGGGLAGGSLGAQLGAAGSLGGPAGAAIGAALGIGVGLLSSLFGGGDDRSVSITQLGDIDPFGGSSQQQSITRVIPTRGPGFPAEVVTETRSPVQVDTNRFDRSAGFISRSLFKVVEDFANAWRDLFLNLPPELFNAFNDGFTISADTLKFESSDKDQQKLQQNLNDFFSGVVGLLIPEAEENLIAGLGAAGLSADAQNVVRGRIDEIEQADSPEERKLLSDEFLKDLAAFSDAQAILEGTASGISNMTTRAANLSSTLGFGSIPSMQEFNEGLREVNSAFELSPEDLKRWEELREQILAIPGAFQQLASTTVSNILSFAEFTDVDSDSLRETLFGALRDNRAFADDPQTIEERLEFLNTERGYLDDIIALERQKFESEREAAQKIKDVFDSVKVLGDSIESSLLSLRTGTDSPLSPAQRVGVVQGSIANLQSQLIGTEGADRVRILERLVPLFNQLPGLGSLFGAGSPEARALFAQGESGLEDLLEDEEFKSQNERLASIGEKLDSQFTVSDETKTEIANFRIKNEELLGEIRDDMKEFLDDAGGRSGRPSGGSPPVVTPSGGNNNSNSRAPWTAYNPDEAVYVGADGQLYSINRLRRESGLPALRIA